MWQPSNNQLALQSNAAFRFLAGCQPSPASTPRSTLILATPTNFQRRRTASGGWCRFHSYPPSSTAPATLMTHHLPYPPTHPPTHPFHPPHPTSASWNGMVTSALGGNVTFQCATSGRDTFLWVGNQLLCPKSSAAQPGGLPMAPGQKYPLRLEVFHNSSEGPTSAPASAPVVLEWDDGHEGQFTVVPQVALSAEVGEAEEARRALRTGLYHRGWGTWLGAYDPLTHALLPESLALSVSTDACGKCLRFALRVINLYLQSNNPPPPPPPTSHLPPSTFHTPHPTPHHQPPSYDLSTLATAPCSKWRR